MYLRLLLFRWKHCHNYCSNCNNCYYNNLYTCTKKRDQRLIHNNNGSIIFIITHNTFEINPLFKRIDIQISGYKTIHIKRVHNY